MSFTVLPEALKSECSTKLLDDFWNNSDFETGLDPGFSQVGGGGELSKKLVNIFLGRLYWFSELSQSISKNLKFWKTGQ